MLSLTQVIDAFAPGLIASVVYVGYRSDRFFHVVSNLDEQTLGRKAARISATFSYIKKEFRLLVRSPIAFLNCVMMNLIWPAILVVMMFVWASAYGAMFGTYQLLAGTLNDYVVFIYATAFANQIMSSYFLRMASVYMLSIGSLWTRTKVVPRWLTIVTYIVAVPFLLFAGALREARFLFPAWVLLVSIFILILNFRRKQESEGDEEVTLEA